MIPGTFWRISSSLWVTFKSLPHLLCIPKTAMDLYFLKAYVPSETPRRFKLHLCNHTTTQTKNSFIENHLNHPKSSSKCFTSLLTVIHNKSDLSSAFNNFKRQISVASGWLSEPALPAIFSIHISGRSLRLQHKADILCDLRYVVVVELCFSYENSWNQDYRTSMQLCAHL